jgi:hypothetical protein
MLAVDLRHESRNELDVVADCVDIDLVVRDDDAAVDATVASALTAEPNEVAVVRREDCASEFLARSNWSSSVMPVAPISRQLMTSCPRSLISRARRGVMSSSK